MAFFISPHGFGHASRASAVMAALRKIDPNIRFSLFTTIPSWFFEDSIPGEFEYNLFVSDIGLIQRTPFNADIPATIRKLDQFLPFDPSCISDTAQKLKNQGYGLIMCDISPIGIMVAKDAGIPSILIENFTWDWLYLNYVSQDIGLKKHIDYLEDIFKMADYHVQTEPVCNPENSDLTALPVSREIKTGSQNTRKTLGISEHSKVVLITTGGIQEHMPFMDRLMGMDDICFIIPGSVNRMDKGRNIVLLPHRSDFFHPDLVNASDLVIGKVGYSTLAEVYQAGVPFGYIARKDFRESDALVSFIRSNIPSIPIEEHAFYSGDWLNSELLDLLRMPPQNRDLINGADQVADFIFRLMKDP